MRKTLALFVLTAICACLAYLSVEQSLKLRRHTCVGLCITDTIVVNDTIRDTTIIEMWKREVRVDTAWLVTADSIHDTIKVYVPISQHYFSSQRWEGWFSGYSVTCDSVNVFESTIYLPTETNVSKAKKWACVIGPYAGVDYWRCWSAGFSVSFGRVVF